MRGMGNELTARDLATLKRLLPDQDPDGMTEASRFVWKHLAGLVADAERGRQAGELAQASQVFAFDGGLLLSDEQRGRAAARLSAVLEAFEGKTAEEPVTTL